MLVEVYENKVNEQNGGATDPETSAENTKTRMAKSDRSRKVIWASGAVFRPIAARRSDIIDGDDVREPEYAESKEVFQPSRPNRRRQRHEQGGVGGASKTSRPIGTTAVDIIPNKRILFHVSVPVWRVRCMRTDVRVFKKMGDNSCPSAPPIGLAVATIQSNEDHCLPES